MVWDSAVATTRLGRRNTQRKYSAPIVFISLFVLMSRYALFLLVFYVADL